MSDCSTTYCHNWLCSNTPCGQGTFDNTTACIPCALGSASANANVMGSCPLCNAGYAAPSVGLIGCYTCLKGKYSNATGNTISQHCYPRDIMYIRSLV